MIPTKPERTPSEYSHHFFTPADLSLAPCSHLVRQEPSQWKSFTPTKRPKSHAVPGSRPPPSHSVPRSPLPSDLLPVAHPIALPGNVSRRTTRSRSSRNVRLVNILTISLPPLTCLSPAVPTWCDSIQTYRDRSSSSRHQPSADSRCLPSLVPPQGSQYPSLNSHLPAPYFDPKMRRGAQPGPNQVGTYV